jgi:putative transposase
MDLCNISRFCYNFILGESIKLDRKVTKEDLYTIRSNYRNYAKNRSFVNQKNQRYSSEFYDLLQTQPSQIPDKEIENVFKAWSTLKKHPKPSFKKKNTSRNSFTLHKKAESTFKLENNKLKVAKMEFDVKKTRFLNNAQQIKLITVTQSSYGWYLSICMEIPNDTFQKQHDGSMVGIDWGVKNFASDSDGNSISFKGQDETSKYDKIYNKLKHLQSIQGKKRHRNKDGWKKSKRYQKISNKVKVCYEKLANIRSNFLHFVSKHYVTNYDYIAIEDLKPSNLLKNHKLARSISESMFYTWKVMLQYKAKFYNVIVDLKDPRNTSQTCSCCGHVLIDKLTLNNRIFKCESCGHEEDRDINAAKNILNKKTYS